MAGQARGPEEQRDACAAIGIFEQHERDRRRNERRAYCDALEPRQPCLNVVAQLGQRSVDLAG